MQQNETSSSNQTCGPCEKRCGITSCILGFLRKACIVIGAFFLLTLFLAVLSAIFMDEQNSESLPKDMILVMNLEQPISETELGQTFSNPFDAPGMTVRSFVESLDKAANDNRVRGLLVSLDNGAFELAHIQEMRSAVKRFRESGKFAHIYTTSFADLRSGIGAYYLASSFDEIWMQPIGFVSITGLSLEMPFAKAALDKIGANPEFLHREEYKSAMESVTNTKMSPANREMMKSILDDMSAQIFTDISTDRKIENTLLQALLDKGLVSGSEAVKTGLVTKMGYADELLDGVRKKITGKDDTEEPPLVLVEDYYAAMGSTGENASIALIQINGQIVAGSSAEPGMATSDYIASAIMEATENEAIKVIVLRIDSPGGSPTASETIRRAIVEAKKEDKKIVVSMGPVAASGGYWIAADADKIYALPSTLTGSIGVIMGKFELSKLWSKVGITWDGLQWGENADLWSMNTPLDEKSRSVLNEAIDDTYMAFLDRVSEGRKMDKDEVRAIAKGRAWTGTQAIKNGLVDEIGGLDSAILHAAELAEIKDTKNIDILVLPKPLTPFEQIMQMMGGQISVVAILPLFKSVEPEWDRWTAIKDMGPVQVYDPSLPIIRP